MNQGLHPLDIVIAWVDGNDISRKINAVNLSIKTNHQMLWMILVLPSNDEIYFCIASILKYVPYAGTIYVVTDQQTPLWLDRIFPARFMSC